MRRLIRGMKAFSVIVVALALAFLWLWLGENHRWLFGIVSILVSCYGLGLALED